MLMKKMDGSVLGLAHESTICMWWVLAVYESVYLNGVCMCGSQGWNVEKEGRFTVWRMDWVRRYKAEVEEQGAGGGGMSCVLRPHPPPTRWINECGWFKSWSRVQMKVSEWMWGVKMNGVCVCVCVMCEYEKKKTWVSVLRETFFYGVGYSMVVGWGINKQNLLVFTISFFLCRRLSAWGLTVRHCECFVV